MCICSCVPTACSELSGCVVSLVALAEMPPQFGQGCVICFGKTGVQGICCGVQSFEQHRVEERFVSAAGAGCLSDLQLLVTVWSPLNH